MKHWIPFTLVFTLVVLAGAGCTNTDTSDQAVAPPVQQEAPADQADNTSEDTTTKNAMTFPGKLADEEIQNKQVRIRTEKGDIVFELFPETAPLAVSNFVSLAQEGFYDNLTFHRRVENFVIQGGDPNGNGTGGPGYTFEDELDDEYSYERGIVAMANRGPDTNGSQFFIMLADNPLPKNYTIFGTVLEGMDIVDDIQIGDTMTEVTIEDMGESEDEAETETEETKTDTEDAADDNSETSGE